MRLDSPATYFAGRFSYLHSILYDDVPLVDRPSFKSAVWEFSSSLIAHPRFDYLCCADPLPFVQDLYNNWQNLSAQ